MAIYGSSVNPYGDPDEDIAAGAPYRAPSNISEVPSAGMAGTTFSQSQTAAVQQPASPAYWESDPTGPPPSSSSPVATAFRDTVDRRTRAYKTWLNKQVVLGQTRADIRGMVSGAYASGEFGAGKPTYGQLTEFVEEQVAPGYRSRYLPRIEQINIGRRARGQEPVAPMGATAWGQLPEQAQYRRSSAVDPSTIQDDPKTHRPQYAAAGVFELGGEFLIPTEALEHTFVAKRYWGATPQYGQTVKEGASRKRSQQWGKHTQTILRGTDLPVFTPELRTGSRSLRADPLQEATVFHTLGEMSVAGQQFYNPQRVHGATNIATRPLWAEPGMDLPTVEEAQKRIGETWREGARFKAAPGHVGWVDPWHGSTLRDVGTIERTLKTGETQRGLAFQFEQNIRLHRAADKFAESKAVFMPHTGMARMTTAAGVPMDVDFIRSIKDIQGLAFTKIQQMDPKYRTMVAQRLGVSELPGSYQELGAAAMKTFAEEIVPEQVTTAHLPGVMHESVLKMFQARGIRFPEIHQRGDSPIYDVVQEAVGLYGRAASMTMEEYGQGDPYLNYMELEKMKRQAPEYHKRLMEHPEVIARQKAYRAAFSAYTATEGVTTDPAGTMTLQAGVESPVLSQARARAHIAEAEVTARANLGLSADDPLPRGAANIALMNKLAETDLGGHIAYEAGKERAVSIGATSIQRFAAGGDVEGQELSRIYTAEAEAMRAYAAGGTGMGEAIGRMKTAQQLLASGQAIPRGATGVTLPKGWGKGDVLKGSLALGPSEILEPGAPTGAAFRVFASPSDPEAYSFLTRNIGREAGIERGMDPDIPQISMTMTQKIESDADGDLVVRARATDVGQVGTDTAGNLYEIPTGHMIQPVQKLERYAAGAVARGAGSLEDELVSYQTEKQLARSIQKGSTLRWSTKQEIAKEVEGVSQLSGAIGRTHNIPQVARGVTRGAVASEAANVLHSIIHSKAQRPAEQTRGAATFLGATAANWDTGWGADIVTGEPFKAQGGKGPQHTMRQMIRGLADPELFEGGAGQFSAEHFAALALKKGASPERRAATMAAFTAFQQNWREQGTASEQMLADIEEAAYTGMPISEVLTSTALGNVAAATTGLRGERRAIGAGVDPADWMAAHAQFTPQETADVLAAGRKGREIIDMMAHGKGADLRKKTAAMIGRGQLPGVAMMPVPAAATQAVGASAQQGTGAAAATGSSAGAVVAGSGTGGASGGGGQAVAAVPTAAPGGPGGFTQSDLLQVMHGVGYTSAEAEAGVVSALSRKGTPKSARAMTQEYEQEIMALSGDVRKFSDALKDTPDITEKYKDNLTKLNARTGELIEGIKGMAGWAGSRDPAVQAARTHLQTQLPGLEAVQMQLRGPMRAQRLQADLGIGAPADGGGGQFLGGLREAGGAMFGRALGGWGMFYLMRMARLATGAMQEGFKAYTGYQAGVEQALYGAGLTEGVGGVPGEVMGWQAAREANQIAVGRAAWNTWGPVLQDVTGSQTGGLAGMVTSALLPGIMTGAATTYLASAIPTGALAKMGLTTAIGLPFGVGAGLIVGGAVTAWAVGRYVEGQGRDVSGLSVSALAADERVRQARAAGQTDFGAAFETVWQDPGYAFGMAWNALSPTGRARSAEALDRAAAAYPVARGGLAGMEDLTPEQQRAALDSYIGIELQRLVPELAMGARAQLAARLQPWAGAGGIPEDLIQQLGKQYAIGGAPMQFGEAAARFLGVRPMEDPAAYLGLLGQVTDPSIIPPYQQPYLGQAMEQISQYKPALERAGFGVGIEGVRGGEYEYMTAQRWDRMGTGEKELFQQHMGYGREWERLTGTAFDFNAIPRTSWDSMSAPFQAWLQGGYDRAGTYANMASGVMSQALGYGVPFDTAQEFNLGILQDPRMQSGRMHTAQLMMQRNPMVWSQLAAQDVGGLMSQFGMTPMVHLTGENQGINVWQTQQWDLARQQQGLRMAGQFGGMGFTGQFPMQEEALRVGREHQLATTGLGWQYQQAQFRSQEAGLGLQQRGMELGWRQQEYGMQTQEQRGGRRYQWQMEDWSYSENVRQMQFGWQMEDYDEAIRFATGRQRMLLQRKKGRAVIGESMAGEHHEDVRERMEEARGWQLEDHEMQRQWFGERKTLQEAQHQLAVDQFNAMEEYQTELHELQVDHATFTYDQQVKQLADARLMAIETDKIWQDGQNLTEEAARHSAEWQNFYDFHLREWMPQFKGQWDDLLTYLGLGMSALTSGGTPSGGGGGSPSGGGTTDYNPNDPSTWPDGAHGDRRELNGVWYTFVRGRGWVAATEEEEGIPGDIQPTLTAGGGQVAYSKSASASSRTRHGERFPVQRRGDRAESQRDSIIAILAAIEKALATGRGEVVVHVESPDVLTGAEVGLNLADALWAN